LLRGAGEEASAAIVMVRRRRCRCRRRPTSFPARRLGGEEGLEVVHRGEEGGGFLCSPGIMPRWIGTGPCFIIGIVITIIGIVIAIIGIVITIISIIITIIGIVIAIISIVIAITAHVIANINISIIAREGRLKR